MIFKKDRKYGVPFYKITIPFTNHIGDIIGVHHIRSTTSCPIELVGTQAIFKDIDGELHHCHKTDWINHGPASEEEMYNSYG